MVCQSNDIGKDDKGGADNQGHGGLDIKGTAVWPHRQPSGATGRSMEAGGVVGMKGVASCAKDSEAHEEREESGAAAGNIKKANGAPLSIQVSVLILAVLRVNLELGRGVGLLLEDRHDGRSDAAVKRRSSVDVDLWRMLRTRTIRVHQERLYIITRKIRISWKRSLRWSRDGK